MIFKRLPGTSIAVLILFAVQFNVSWSQDASQDELLRLEEEAVRNAVARVSNSVIQIETIGASERIGETATNQGPTTGLVVDAAGYIVSSQFNFVGEPSAIFVRLPSGKRATAQIICRDTSRKLVLLKVELTGDERLPVPEALSRDDIEVGQRTIALGKVFDATSANISVGIVSAVNRIWGKAIQTDAKISPANFGGPLIDLRGRVIGVLVPMSNRSNEDLAGSEWYDSGIGFAIPLTEINQQLEKLKRGETLHPGLVGIAFEGSNIYNDTALVATCFGNSPASKAGIRPGDEVVQFNGKPIQRQAQFRHALGPLYAGDVVGLTIRRDGDEFEATFELVEKLEPFVQPWLGITPDRSVLNNELVAKTVIKGSPADTAGIIGGDVVVKLGNSAVASYEDLQRGLIESQISGDQFLTVRRDDVLKQLNVRLATIPETWDSTEKVPDVDNSLVEVRSLKIPEEKNDCLMLVPDGADSLPGILVWVPQPGAFDAKKVAADWSQLCQAYNLVLLMPRASHPDRWSPGEADLIRKLTEQALSDIEIDRNRVAIGGSGAGGAMAALTVMPNRDLFRGLILQEASIPGRLENISTEPTRRALVLAISAKPSMGKAMAIGVDKLREARFPVQTATCAESEIRIRIFQWLDMLDQL